MLKKRILTGLGLLIVVVAAIYGLSNQLFALFLAVVIGVAAWEWSELAGLRKTAARTSYVLLILGGLYLSRETLTGVTGPILVAGLLWWLLAFSLIFFYPRFAGFWGRQHFLIAAGFFLFIPSWMGMLFLREKEFYVSHILLLLSLVAAADMGAYFFGRAYGRNKLAPRVSPAKTWEGFCGGLLACCVLVSLSAFCYSIFYSGFSAKLWLTLNVSAMLLASFSMVGDLLESMIKRYRDVKDSGNILPGHGGVMDRIDGLTAAVPVYALLVMLITPGLA